jgi:desulfoferrodoxin-like iron-binding protein
MKRTPRGTIYRCPVCGAEVSVLARRYGKFDPVCCGVSMEMQPRRLVFYVCPVCHSEVAVLHMGGGTLRPRCCNTDMRREAA